MSQEAVDYSFSPPTVASLVVAGKVAAGRYVGAGTEDKQIHAAERDALFAAGLAIWLSVEGAADSALQGGKTGAYHARLAVADARALAVPAGVAMYGNCDFDVQVGQWLAVVSYMTSFGKVVREAGYRVGFYGGRNAMVWGIQDGLADFYWQTYAWSGTPTRWVPGVAIQQYKNGVPMGGGDVDLNRIMVADYGQWVKGGIAPPTKGDDVRFGVQAQGSAAVEISDLMERRGGFTWDRFKAWVDGGLITKPPAGSTTASPTGYGSYVWVVPAAEMDGAFGKQVAAGGAGVTVEQATAIARSEIGRSTNTPGT